jgi:hypothetical protein
MMKRTLLLGMAIAAATVPVLAQKKKNNKKKGAPAASAEAPKPKEDKPSIASKTKNCKRIPGLFTLFRDTNTGKSYLLIKKTQLGKEFIHFTYTENGVTDAGFHRGQFRGSRIFKIKKHFEYIDFEQQNTGFYFNPNSELSKSADANISHSSLAYEKIIATDEKTGEYLIDADELFLSEKLHQIKPSGFPGNPMAFNLGGLSRSKTRYEQLKNYPMNTDLVVRYVFENPYPINGGSEEVTDARATNVVVQHSLIEMPADGYKPRFDDPRIGYFSDQVNDMTTTAAVNYRDMIHRWDLRKKDPAATKSEPVKPIVWWIENTTPKELRSTIKAAGEAWNKAFEPLGFINAVQVKEQPDTADWDAGDIRYNVLRWTSSPNPPFGGYGPSFVNPRTGEILGADIMLEYVFVTNRLVAEKLFEVKKADQHYCEAGHTMHNEMLLGAETLRAAGASEIEITKLINQSLHYLVLHEMGHTLGLQHNMKASQLLSPAQLKDKNITANGLIGSVMDYPAINLNGDVNAVDYCQTAPGPYDMWAIEYGYSLALDDEKAENERLAKILSRSGEKELTFGNDADDMRAPGKAIDPRVMVNDLSSDAITYGIERIEKVQLLMRGLKNRYTSGVSWQELRNAYGSLSGAYGQMTGIISRYVGGVYVERVAPATNSTAPYTPVAYADQKRAMNALAKYAFAPNAMEVPAEIAAYLQPQRRGYNFFGTTEDPKFHSRVDAMQNGVLDHLLSTSTMLRLSDSRLYGNKYSVGEMLGDLTKAIFDEDLNGNVNTFRQVLQINYTERLIAITGLKGNSRHDEISKARATAQLQEIYRKLKSSTGVDKDGKDHRNYVLTLIEKALDD